MLIVGSQIDPASERIIRYLSTTYGVSINAATFQYFKGNAGEEYLGLNKNTTISWLSFSGSIGGSRKAILSLIPTESSQEDGLRFQMYLARFRSFFNTDPETVKGLLPERREDWNPYPGASEDLSGYAGYFRTEEEVGQFIAGLKKLKTQ